MDYNELLEELRSLESESMECKASFREEDFGRTFAAFATKNGGKLFLGVDPMRNPVGIIWNQELKDKITQVARVCEPSVSISIHPIIHDNEKSIICIKVDKGNGHPYSYKKTPYERRQGVNHPLNVEEVLEIQKRSKKLYFDEMPAKSKDRPGLMTDIDIEKVKEYILKSNGIIKEPFDLKQFLTNQELSINGSGKVKNAAIMLFGKNPIQFIPQSKVSVSIFPSNTITSEFIKAEVSGDLESIYRKSFLEVMRAVRTFSLVKGSERIDVPEYPPEIIRESIINSIVHRDYFIDSTEVFIKIFKDRIEITNPGGFPFSGFSWEEIEKSGLSIRRNQIIANFFEKIKLMEKEGHGIKRIKSLAKSHGLKEPLIETSANTFKITLFGPGDEIEKIINSPFRKVLDSSQLNERQIKIIQHINEKGSINRSECCRLLGVPLRTASRDLKFLFQKGFVGSTGTGRGTRYIAT